MVGNDVVDLRDDDALPEAAPRFDARVFCADELASLDTSPRRARRRWRLWAAKEAAYKVALKQNPATIFAPSRFRVRLADEAELGVVEMPPGSVPVRIVEADGAVHAVASTASGRLVTGVLRIDGRDRASGSDPGEIARRFAREQLAARLAVPIESLEIRKHGRVPELWQRGARAAADLSLSHHGDVVAFACEISP